MLARLTAPEWPEEHLGLIDRKKAELGRQLYADNCAKCHGIRDENGNFPMTTPNKFGKQFIKTHMITVFPPDRDKIGTDPLMVLNFVTRKAKLVRLQIPSLGTSAKFLAFTRTSN